MFIVCQENYFFHELYFMFSIVPSFLLRYLYNRLKCIICNYINSDLFTFLFDCPYQLF